MNKYWPIILASIIGLFFGNLLFNSYQEETVMASEDNLYMLQYGAYTNKKVVDDITKKLVNQNYLVVKEEDIYYIYFAVTTNYENASLIKKYFNSQNIFLYIKNNYINNELLIEKIKKIDNKILNSKEVDIKAYSKDTLNIYKSSN